MFSSKSLPLSDAESEFERMTDLEKFGLKPYSLEPIKSKIPVAYGRNSVSDLDSSNDVATNGVNGRIGNKSWCKCECCTCTSMDTSVEGICFLEIPEICKSIFSSTLAERLLLNIRKTRSSLFMKFFIFHITRL